MRSRLLVGASVAAVALTVVAAPAHAADLITPISTIDVGPATAAEIAAFDAATDRLFVLDTPNNEVDVYSLADPANPTPVGSLALAAYGAAPNSVAAKNGVVVVAVEKAVKQDPGAVARFDAATLAPTGPAAGYPVGALPDMLTFTPDGGTVLVANEGEPDATVTINPEGSVSIIDLATGTVRTAGFAAYDAQYAALEASGVRMNFPGATVSQDLEPEYITVGPDGRKAYVSLQEANTIATVDIASATVTALTPLGTKDHGAAGNQLDPSDRDGAASAPLLNIGSWPVHGLYMPDAVASFTEGGTTYVVTANEGDGRDYGAAFLDESRVGAAGYVLDPTAFPNAAALKGNAQLGRLTATRTDGDTDGDGDIDRITIYGGRSFSIVDPATGVVWDSGDQIERKVAELFPAIHNSDGAAASFDTRSDNKGPEPEAVAVGTVEGRRYAFVGLERAGGVMAFDITVPSAPTFADYANPAVDGSVIGAADVSPEGLVFVDAADSPNGLPLLIVSNEVSGTVTVYRLGTELTPVIPEVPLPVLLPLSLLLGLGGVVVLQRRRTRLA
jgi:DNA-binding beta-propeller fold protein YncE